jgi:hypothetical protein
MDRFIGFDVDHKRTVACLRQAGRPDRYAKLRTEVSELREWLQAQRGPGDRLHWTETMNGHFLFAASEAQILPARQVRFKGTRILWR